MKLCRIITLLAALLASTIPDAFAAAPLKVQVPFAFIVGSRTMPAGDYTVAPSNNGSAILYIHGAGSGVAVLSSPIAIAVSSNSATSSLVFETRGSQHYLVAVRMGDEPGRSIPAPAFKRSSLTALR